MKARRTILVLEDNDDRIFGFQAAVASVVPPLDLKIWFDAPTMIAEMPAWFDEVCIFSLDHDLSPRFERAPDPGTGWDVAEFLAGHPPVCPVLIHSSNTERAWSMHNELRFSGWTVDRIGPVGSDWISTLWLPKVRNMLGGLVG